MKAVPLIGIARHRLTIDGEGVTTLVAFHGCPLRCKYCLNPTSLQPDGVWESYDCNQLYEEVRKDELYFGELRRSHIWRWRTFVTKRIYQAIPPTLWPRMENHCRNLSQCSATECRRTDFYYRQLHSRHQRYE